ncbi:MAG: hypothetical protein Q9208_004500 [Pyrenodesmia sp. 3 TL-2023]
MPPYRYKPLDPEAKTIRLMRLLPGNFDDDIRVSLRTTVLTEEHVPEYEALSYAWGSMEKPRDIRVADDQDIQDLMKRLRVPSTMVHKHIVITQTLAVTQNLGEALPYLRRKEGIRDLWIDAICVNQQNFRERGFQVERMADVYRNAQRVIVWLGPTSYRTPLAIDTLRFLSSQIEMDWNTSTMKPSAGGEAHWADPKINLPYDKETWKSIYSLLSKSWFKRLWICQEIMLSKSAKLECGHNFLDWGVLQAAVFPLSVKPRAPTAAEENPPNYPCVLNQALLITQGRAFETSLTSLLFRTQDCECTDPRDRIYALSNIVHRADSVVGLKPDYTRTSRTIYRDVVLRSMVQERSLGLVGLCEWGADEVRKPTWVPDFSEPRRSSSIYFSRSCWGSMTDADYMGKGLLRVTGLSCAEISSVQTHMLDHNGVPPIRLIQLLARKLDLDATYIDGSQMIEAFCGMLCMDRWDDELAPTLAYCYPDRGSSLRLLRSIMETSECEAESISDLKYLNYVRNCVRGRCFITTKEGYIGLAPEAAKVGDKICVVLGCQMPLLLRPSFDGRHTVVGGCYVQGLMRGEAILGPLPDRWQYRWINSDSSVYNFGFVDQLTEQYVYEDPRHGPLPSPWRLERPGVKADMSNWFINNEIGETLNWPYDPRMSTEALRKRGVPLRDFLLE